MITIRRYTPADRELWDNFVKEAKNSTFLHLRGYMDYHSGRFTDHSLIASDGGRTLALLPANEDGTTIHSHQGLTYGGWLTPAKHFNANTMLEVFGAMKAFLSSEGFTRLRYKAVPHIYHRYPAEEDVYALFRFGARVSEVNMSSTVQLGANRIPCDRLTRRNVKKAEMAGMRMEQTDDFPTFWKILSDNLAGKYGAKPVHTLPEIELLHSRFPNQIQLFMAYIGEEAVAGAVVYVMGRTIHAQYSSATERGSETGALAFLWQNIMNTVCIGHDFFDFGTSNENHGLILNPTLLQAKAAHGARGIAYVIYEMPLDGANI